MGDANDFLRALFRDLAYEELAYCIFFSGDPGTFKRWGAGFGWHDGRALPSPEQNGYVCVSAMQAPSELDYFRRKTDAFTGGFALMVDDVGTKVPRSVTAPLMPSARILTSPGNEQQWYFLDKPLRHADLFKDFIDSFIRTRCGNDPGMAGVNRLARLPGYLNMKPAYGGSFRTQLLELNDKRYSVGELIDAFKLPYLAPKPDRSADLTNEVINGRVEVFRTALAWINAHGMLLKNRGRQIDITCPWIADHTGQSNTGTALILPEQANEYNGAFRCHHGHCQDKKLRHVTDWINEKNEAAIEQAVIHKTDGNTNSEWGGA